MECSLPITVTAVAEAIAAQTQSTAELAVLGTLFSQLGDTLQTIAAIRACKEECKNNSATKSINGSD